MSNRLQLIPALIVLVATVAAARSQPSQQRQVTPAALQQTTTATQAHGNYYALVIGIDNYQNLPKLGTAVSDAKAIARELHDQYKFEVTLLTDDNASYQKIVGALSDYVHKLQEDDSLLIYYAGHGLYDKSTETAYWLPVDAEPDDDVYWILASLITTHVHAMRARHVLVVSDSCYSGMLSRAVNATNRPPNQTEYIRNMLRGRSRHLMSSGGNEPVADGGAPDHSVFSWAFLRALNGMNEEAFTATDLFSLVQRQVAGGSEQVPQYMPIRDSGDVEGDFVFFHSRASVTASSRPGAAAESSRPASGTSTNQPPRTAQLNDKGHVDLSAAKPAEIAAAVTPASGPNFEGKWIEINPRNPENPRNLVLQQGGGQVVFAGFRLTVNQGGVATWSGPQGCAPKFQRPGYDYGASGMAGTAILMMSLQGSTLIYENGVNWRVPCDGHQAGEERYITKFQRVAGQTPMLQQSDQSQAGFRVSKVSLDPTPASYQGRCPVAIRYRGVIVASGPGTVHYTFLRSDNATAPVSAVQFESAGAKEVFVTWQVGSAGRTFELWEALRILDPGPAVESNKAITNLVCEDGGWK
jgi:hypothetical protein